MDEQIASTAFIVCRPNEALNSRYLFHFLRQDAFIRSITTYGDSPPAGHDDEFVRLPISIAPIKEQERIADALDELLSDLDAGVEALTRAKAKLELYRASVLKAAVGGDLTSEWRKAHSDAEPATALLPRILKERRRRWEEEQLRRFKEQGKNPLANWKSKYKEPVVPDAASLPQLPQGWCWASVEQISSVIVDCPHSTPAFIERGRPCVDTTCMKTAGIVLSALRYVSEESHLNRVCRLVPQEGDIIFAREGTVGTAVIVPPDLNPCLGQRVMLMRCSFGILPQYLKASLDSAIVRNQYQPKLQGSTVNHLNVADVRTLGIPLPPLEEQNVIAELIADQLDWIERINDEMPFKMDRGHALKQCVLQTAFRGQLIPQDLTDEPASELLKRMAAERATRGKQPRARQPRRPAKRRKQTQAA